MKSEVKRDPNLRRLHLVTKTDKGKDKNKRKSSLYAGTQFCIQRRLFEPHSRQAAEPLHGKTHPKWREVALCSHIREVICADGL